MNALIRYVTPLLLLSAAPLYAAEAVCTNDCHPYYFGVNAGYGSTTWVGLVPDRNNQNAAMNLSVPINVNEGGAAWGLFLGYEVSPFFAIEADYMHYPNATLYFGTDSIFYFDNGDTTLRTATEAVSVLAKIMMVIPRSQIRAFSGAGIALLHRDDNVNDARRVTPTFVFGFNYNITPHVMTELTGSYTAGFGESELEPTKDYMPFLYAIYLSLAYKI